MSAGYAVVQRNRRTGESRVWQVVWRAEEAESIVDRLNAMGSATSSRSWSWAPVWVNRREANVRVELTPDDREKLALARDRGGPDTTWRLCAFFSFVFNRQGGARTCAELRALGWPDVGMDEELTGDKCFHVYAHGRSSPLSEQSIRALRAQMERLAELNGGVFDEWDFS